MALRWCILKQDSQVGFRGLDGGRGVEKVVLGVLEALKPGEVRVGDVGVRYSVLRNDRGGVACQPDWPWRYLLGVYGDDCFSGGGGGGGGEVLCPSPNLGAALCSRLGVVFLR